jgi:PhzF family phenazine biosynthesis protein
MPAPLFVVDAFTDRPFSGNPAAVCLLEEPAAEEWMQAVAAEVNLSETAFVVPRGGGDHDLRWFTPSVEIDLCGHATLASAHVLGGFGRFHTRSGVLTCTAGNDGSIDMDFPARPVEPSGDDTAPWSSVLGLGADRIVAVHRRPDWILVEVRTASDVEQVVADLEAMRTLSGHCLVAADTTSDASEIADSVCRLFAPGSGIDEDPVTGSAHCVLAPWLAARTGRTTFVGRQASRRGGIVGMRLEEDRVILSGHAVTVSEGRLLAEPPA